MTAVKHQVVSIYDLVPSPENYNEHPQEQLEELKASLRRFGQVENIVVKVLTGKKFKIVAHEGVTTAALQLLEAGECPHLEQCGITIVPDHWTDLDVRGYMIASNETARKSNAELASLANLLQEQVDAGHALESMGSDEEALRQLLESLGDAMESDGLAGDDDEDFEGEVDEEQTRVKLGDVWQLGEHRLLVGDCTSRKDIKRLMGNAHLDLIVTDPPYGVSYADKNRFLNAIGRPNSIEEPIANDHGKIEDVAEKVWKPAYTTMHGVAKEGCVIYCCAPQGGDQMMMMMMMMMMHPLFPVRHELIWLKNNHVLGRADYAYKHEPILYAWKGTGHKYHGGFQTSILEFDRPQKSDLHPTMKPLALFTHLIRNSSLKGENVGDWFLGSGTTLIACERTGRICYGCELDPRYANVILSRYEEETGQQARLLERIEEASHA